ncbi:unnamed protein product [Cylicocyclus nassatus]|uniref:Major facilitator superfamily (MFS) profile domain-containing protein n=1 Tax=Cylicocyclus nassatus TaxID=53992 RepID=A0AA36M9F1_CYLNA|nr:unnamed protein product [Cylicocyclus nassatus]
MLSIQKANFRVEMKRKPTAERAPLFHPYSRRFHLVLLLAFGFFCTTFMRMHLAISMTCMVNSTAVALIEEMQNPYINNTAGSNLIEEVEQTNAFSSEQQCEKRAEDGHTVVVDYGGTLPWSHQMQNFIFSGTFWGALFVVGPSTLFYHRCSPRLLLLAAVVVYILSTAVTPLLAVNFGAYTVFAARVIMGFGEGFVIPSINAMISNWFPVEEKGTVLALYTAGNQFAGAVGNPLAAALCASSLGWPAVFYFIASLSTVWCILWSFTSSDNPRKCGRMTTKERAYLAEAVKHRSNRANKASTVPYASMFTSSAFLAQLLCFFITNVTVTMLHFYLPSFLKDVLLLGVIANGTFSAIPNVINLLFKITWSMLLDKLKSKKIITNTFSVRLSQSVGSKFWKCLVLPRNSVTCGLYDTRACPFLHLLHVRLHGWFH